MLQTAVVGRRSRKLRGQPILILTKHGTDSPLLSLPPYPSSYSAEYPNLSSWKYINTYLSRAELDVLLKKMWAHYDPPKQYKSKIISLIGKVCFSCWKKVKYMYKLMCAFSHNSLWILGRCMIKDILIFMKICFKLFNHEAPPAKVKGNKKALYFVLQ